tara:strand:- start:233 stop:400 length:168 start_codon:yes stop_codon:yes gene_type:complete
MRAAAVAVAQVLLVYQVTLQEAMVVQVLLQLYLVHPLREQVAVAVVINLHRMVEV